MSCMAVVGGEEVGGEGEEFGATSSKGRRHRQTTAENQSVDALGASWCLPPLGVKTVSSASLNGTLVSSSDRLQNSVTKHSPIKSSRDHKSSRRTPHPSPATPSPPSWKTGRAERGARPLSPPRLQARRATPAEPAWVECVELKTIPMPLPVAGRGVPRGQSQRQNPRTETRANARYALTGRKAILANPRHCCCKAQTSSSNFNSSSSSNFTFQLHLPTPPSTPPSTTLTERDAVLTGARHGCCKTETSTSTPTPTSTSASTPTPSSTTLYRRFLEQFDSRKLLGVPSRD